jgi:hypothetical protein
MGIARRIAGLYRVKVDALLDRAEEPRQMLDYSYGQEQEFLRGMRLAVADVAASGNRARAQEDGLRRAADRFLALTGRQDDHLYRDIIALGWALCLAVVAHPGVGPGVREGLTHVPRPPVKECEPSLCRR